MRFTHALCAFALISAGACNRTPASSATTTTGNAAAAAPAPRQSSDERAGAATSAGRAGNTFTGSIAETMDSGGYTYARLKGGAEEVWVAAPQFDAKTGETISVALDMPMQDFESKTLKRTFPMLYFVQEVARNGQPLTGAGRAAAPSMMPGHGAAAADAPAVATIAPPAGGVSIADLFAQKESLSGKPVTVRGTVVKFNGGIMDRNWLHIQDGSGTAEAKNNDLTVTTDAEARVGDVVTATGVLGTNKDFGAGYAYDVIVEKATLAGR